MGIRQGRKIETSGVHTAVVLQGNLQLLEY
jgi:hypothetical protein